MRSSDGQIFSATRESLSLFTGSVLCRETAAGNFPSLKHFLDHFLGKVYRRKYEGLSQMDYVG